MTIRRWCFRIDRRYSSSLYAEALAGRLRQGWGWDPRQDLRDLTFDGGAGRNIRMFNDVKKDHLILVPHLPHQGMIALMRAIQDWSVGYRFEEFEESGDHGHIFPVEMLKYFGRYREDVPAVIRDTFRSPGRFWNVDRLADDIDLLMKLPEGEGERVPTSDRWQNIIEEVVTGSNYRTSLLERMRQSFSKSDWEYILADAFAVLHPGWEVQRCGGTSEVIHGTDILLTTSVPGSDERFGVAAQVKDYRGAVGNHPVEQIVKARDGFWEGIKVVDCVVAIVGGDPEDNARIEAFAREKGVRIMWAKDVESLVLRASMRIAVDRDLA